MGCVDCSPVQLHSLHFFHIVPKLYVPTKMERKPVNRARRGNSATAMDVPFGLCRVPGPFLIVFLQIAPRCQSFGTCTHLSLQTKLQAANEVLVVDNV